VTEQQAFYKQRETKSEATIQQQTKLIDYLQNRIEDANKKKKVSINIDIIKLLYQIFTPTVLFSLFDKYVTLVPQQLFVGSPAAFCWCPSRFLLVPQQLFVGTPAAFCWYSSSFLLVP
jgi:hypothetical protein